MRVADLCAQEGIPFVLGHALYMKATQGGKAVPEVCPQDAEDPTTHFAHAVRGYGPKALWSPPKPTSPSSWRIQKSTGVSTVLSWPDDKSRVFLRAESITCRSKVAPSPGVSAAL